MESLLTLISKLFIYIKRLKKIIKGVIIYTYLKCDEGKERFITNYLESLE